MTAPRLLVAGIGNVFLGDDGFGVEVVQRLAGRPQPPGVQVMDFGIRGFDLACALTSGCAGTILVDTTQRGAAPGTVYLVELDSPLPGSAAPVVFEGHSLDPVRVLQLAQALGPVCPWLRLVGCEPLTFGSDEEPIMGLSEPVELAVEQAIRMIETLSAHFLKGQPARE